MSKKILVVDDDQNIVDYLTELFTANGFETLTAKDGAQALALAKQGKPDLITLDLEMPERWGTVFYRRLEDDGDLSGIPVIVISGLEKHPKDRVLQKAAAYIEKPFEAERLMAVVNSVLT